MKALGIVRRIDDLGRVVVPKEIRDILNYSTGTPIEFYMEDERIILQKYTPDNINNKINELISLIYGQIETIGLDECVALEAELKEIGQIFDK